MPYRLLCALVLCLSCAASPVVAADLTPEILLGAPLEAAAPERAALAQAIERFTKQAPDEAFRALEAAVTQQPKLPPAEILMARLCFAYQQVPQGRGWLERAAVAAAADPESYVLLGGLALREGRLTEASLLFQAGQAKLAAYEANAARRASLEGSVWEGLIAVAEMRAAWPEAERLLRERRQKQPAAGSALRLARVLFFQEKEADAEALLKAEYEAARQTGDTNLHRHEVNFALLLEEQAARLPDGPEKQHLRADARQLMAGAVKADPTGVATQLAVARWALESGDLPIAARCAGDAARLAAAGDPRRSQAQWIIAVTQHGQGDLAGAEKLLRELAQQAPQDVLIRNQLALVLAEKGDAAAIGEALKLAEQNARDFAALSSPLARNLAVSHAFILARAGRKAEADQALAPALEAGGLSGDAWYLAARVYADRGDKAKAAELLRPILASPAIFLWREKAKSLLGAVQKAH